MSIIILTPPPPPPPGGRSAGPEPENRRVRIEVPDVGTLADQLRAAAAILDGQAE